MAGITLQKAQELLDIWLEASASLATRKEFNIGSRRFTSADAKEIQEQIQYWRAEVARLSGKRGLRVRRVVPRDL